MTTIAEVVKAEIIASIDHEYISECGGSLKAVYQSEYGYNGISDKACKDYLQGLPSVCTIPFTNSEILSLLDEQGVSYKDEEYVIDLYWIHAGREFCKLIK